MGSTTKPLPNLSLVQKHLRYDPQTGDFTRLTGRRGRRGSIVGSISGKGYRYVYVPEHGSVIAHRLAWLYVYGREPQVTIDHIDGNKVNNAITNLREASFSQQLMNTKLYKNNTSGYKGVFHVHGKWIAMIQVERRRIRLGLFDNAYDAHLAYQAAAIKHFGEFIRSSGDCNLRPASASQF